MNVKCREVLFKTIEGRNCELEEYKLFLKSLDFTGRKVSTEIQSAVLYKSETDSPSLNSSQQLIKKRYQNLILEYPFQTDTNSINRSHVDDFSINIPTSYRTPEDWAKWRFPGDIKKRNRVLDQLLGLGVWPKIYTTEEDCRGNIREKWINALEEHFNSNKVKNTFFNNIKKNPSLKHLLPLAKEMIDYMFYKEEGVKSLVKANDIKWALRSGLNVETLSSYTEKNS